MFLDPAVDRLTSPRGPYLMDQSLVFQKEISRGIVKGSAAVVTSQKAPEGFTIYRVIFKVYSAICMYYCDEAKADVSPIIYI